VLLVIYFKISRAGDTFNIPNKIICVSRSASPTGPD